MKIYLVKNISGFYLGGFERARWTREPGPITRTECPDVIGIERDILVAYCKYLWRLGYYTFGARYVAVGGPTRGILNLQRFAEYYVLQLWPKWGIRWTAVGATASMFDLKYVMWRHKMLAPAAVNRHLIPYDVILRYQERLWWGRAVFDEASKKWVYEQGPSIGLVLMFELRSPRKTPPKIDLWDFGMSWLETFGAKGKTDWFLWAKAEVEYLGLGVRRSAATVSLR